MSRNGFWRLSLLSITLACATFGVVFAQSEPTDIGVDWAGLFNTDGSLRDDFDDQGAPGANGVADAIDVYGGIDAVFIEDRTSGGAVIDISALRQSLARAVVYHGPVVSPHDLGNAYVFARSEGQDLVIDFRIERLVSAAADASYVEIELNAGSVGTRMGRRSPNDELSWLIQGERSVGDIRVRAHLAGTTVSSVEFESWDDVAGYQPLETLGNSGAETCFAMGTIYTVCGGSLDALGETPIANGDSERVYEPDSYLEFSINFGQLLGANPDYTTIQVCSPEDITLGTFKAFGRHASSSL